jgi:predicted transcriptional regulator
MKQKREPVKITKADAIEHFGGTVTECARMLGVTKSAVSQWPDELSAEMLERVITTSWRVGKPILDRRRNGRRAAA